MKYVGMEWTTTMTERWTAKIPTVLVNLLVKEKSNVNLAFHYF